MVKFNPIPMVVIIFIGLFLSFVPHSWIGRRLQRIVARRRAAREELRRQQQEEAERNSNLSRNTPNLYHCSMAQDPMTIPIFERDGHEGSGQEWQSAMPLAAQGSGNESSSVGNMVSVGFLIQMPTQSQRQTSSPN
ncbi:hypothetical protein FS842_008111 [Serendipita sp. 407]|nr:hypothetical protein FS842_008111 [Serendipita sp. 407]